MAKEIVLLSGGLDSATCLADCLQRYGNPNEIMAVNMRYGQKHQKEIIAAREIAKYYGVELAEYDFSEIFKRSDCALLEQSKKEIEDGSYAEQMARQKKESEAVMQNVEPVGTYVPFRNGLFLAAAASIAQSIGATRITIGIHSDDAAGNAYPDCSVKFAEAIDRAIKIGTGNQVKIHAPFVNLTKAGVVKKGLELGVPYQLTWSCYRGGEKACGKCGTCIDRLKAFELNGTIDPLEYFKK